jgi:hypothetical protein
LQRKICSMKIKNGAARNQMSEFGRQCYDWGWKDAEAEVIKYLKERAGDVRMCHKNDSCADIAYVLESCIEDIQENVDINFQENL